MQVTYIYIYIYICANDAKFTNIILQLPKSVTLNIYYS